jgi:hypothetical protein
MAKRRPDAECIAILGARGSGKSTWFKRLLEERAPTRLGLWDTKREHGLRGTSDLAEFVRALRAPTWRLAFFPTMTDDKRRAVEFNIWCLAMYRAKHCFAGVEELAFVTTPSRSPQGWRTLSLLGRDENPEGGAVTVAATSQRPASIDKDFIGNATLIHAGRLPYEDDAKAVARTLGVTAAELMQLPQLHYVERGQADREARRGEVRFSARTNARRAPVREAAPARSSESLGRVPKGGKLQSASE